MPKLSVVIPASEQASNSFLRDVVETLQKNNDVQVICVGLDEAVSRAERLNIGFHRAQGDMILFHHPRSRIEVTGISHLLNLISDQNIFWGGFTHGFDEAHWLLKFTSWYSNRVRGAGRGVLYLDHCIFFHRSLWKSDLPPVEIFEDTQLSYNFLKHSKPRILPFLSTTSAVRFKKNGIFRQSLMNQVLKIGFFLKVPHGIMNRIYEKGLGLNSKS